MVCSLASISELPKSISGPREHSSIKRAVPAHGIKLQLFGLRLFFFLNVVHPLPVLPNDKVLRLMKHESQIRENVLNAFRNLEAHSRRRKVFGILTKCNLRCGPDTFQIRNHDYIARS